MTELKKLVYCFVLFLLNASINKTTAQSVSSVSAIGHVYAEVIPVFSARETAQMNFGRFSPGPYGGEIILTPESTVSVVGSVYEGIGTHNPATFYVSGDIDASFTITLPNDPVLLKHTSSSKTMTIKNWISKPGTGMGSGILQNGEQTVYVGATLEVGTLADNPVGTYAGTYTITFDFN